MELLMRNRFLVQVAISFCFSIALFTNGSIATQTTNGLLLANLCPQLERGSLGVYAITTSSPSPIGADLDLETSKDTGLPTSATQFSLINIDSYFWGCSLCVHPQKRFRSLRYGIYEATLDSTTTVRTFAKRKTTCPKGRWGADCSQDCPSSESDCNRFRGPNIDEEEKGLVG